MAEKPEPKAGPSKVFDVTRPGKSVPSSTSKPVIISNRPVLKDPMMVDEDKNSDKETETTNQPLMVTSKIKVQPIHDHVVPEDEVEDDKKSSRKEVANKEDEKEPVVSDEIGPIKLSDEDTKSSKETDKDEKDEPNLEDKTPETEEEAPKSESITTATTEPTDQTSQAAQEKINEIANRKAAERAAEIQKLAESHKYFLPINQVEKRRNKRAAWAGVVLVLLLAVVWADVALDAGLVTIPGIKPPTHFFK